jgi:hypothetical protein
MPPSKRAPKTKPKSPPKKAASKKAALLHFTATRKGTVRSRRRAAGPEWWVLIGPISWIKYGKKGVDPRTRRAALRALKRFKKG